MLTPALSDSSDLSSQSSSPQPQKRLGSHQKGALIVPKDPSTRLTARAVVARPSPDPLALPRRISRMPTRAPQSSAENVRKELLIQSGVRLNSGIKRAMDEATAQPRDQAEKIGLQAKRVATAESGRTSEWVNGLGAAVSPPPQARALRPLPLLCQKVIIQPRVFRSRFHSASSSNPAPDDAESRAKAAVAKVQQQLYDPSRSHYDELRRPRERESNTEQRLKQQEVMYAWSMDEITRKDRRIRALQIAGQKKDARIAELEKELEKRKAESQRGAKKKFRFSIEVEVDGDRFEGAVADAEG